jgi:hypothetical protein
VSGATIWPNGIGTNAPPSIEIIAALPPLIRYRAETVAPTRFDTAHRQV